MVAQIHKNLKNDASVCLIKYEEKIRENNKEVEVEKGIRRRGNDLGSPNVAYGVRRH